MSLFLLSGKVALLTGGTNGIGLGYAKGLASADIDQLILTYRSKSTLDTAIKVIKEVNPNVQIDGIEADFLTSDIDKLVETISEEAFKLSKSSKVDILVNNAGTTHRHPFEEFPQKDFDEIISMNLLLPVKLTKQIGSKMLETKTQGSIVFTASLMSFQGGHNTTAYSITKGAIKQFTQALSNEWSPKGIRVNSIAPGYIATNLTDTMDPARREKISQRIPMGRWGDMDDFQGPIVFLVSDAGRYVTGETLVVDGGWLGA